MHKEKLTLATICGGAVQEKVDRALEKVARNILDPNTDPSKKRTVTLKLVFKPDDNDIEDVEVSAEVTTSLAPEVGVKTRLYVNNDLKTKCVTVMEHQRGEIKGQLDFSDIGFLQEKAEQEADDYDPDIDDEMDTGILDFRKRG